MSQTVMTSGNSLAVKVFEKRVWVQAMQQAVLGHLFNRGAIYFPEKFLGTDRTGDQTTFPYVGKLSAVPLGEGQTADGNEEALDLQSHNMIINVSRIPVLSPNNDTIEQQRTSVKFDDNSARLIKNRAVELMDTGVFYQLAGANPTTLTINGTTYSTAAQKLHVQGHNTPVAPSTNRIIRCNGAANDQSLTSTDTMRLDLIDYALELNNRSDQPIEPFADGTFDFFMSPEQATNLKQDTTGAIQWFNVELAKITGGKTNEFEDQYKNGIMCVGRYANVYLYVAGRTAYGLNSGTSAVITTVRRAVLVGQNALSFASPFGGRVTDTDVPMKMFYQLKDYEYYKGAEGRLIYGIKKMIPSNKDDIGVIVIVTYAAANT